MDEALESFFEGRPEARRLFEAIERAILAIGPARIRVTKGQVAFSRHRGFAWAWMPDRWLRGPVPPLVLSIALPRRDRSPRWKQVVEPSPGRWMHHLELRGTTDVDDEVRACLKEAWDDADRGAPAGRRAQRTNG
jgi:hypothetical protein